MTSKSFILLVITIPIVLLNPVEATVIYNQGNYDLNTPNIYKNAIAVNNVKYPWPINTNVDRNQPTTHTYSSTELNLLGLNNKEINKIDANIPNYQNDKKYNPINLQLHNPKLYQYTFLDNQTKFNTHNVSPTDNIVYHNVLDNIVYRQIMTEPLKFDDKNSMKNLGLAQFPSKDGSCKRIVINPDKTLYRYVSPPGEKQTLVIKPKAENRTQQPSPIKQPTTQKTCKCKKFPHKDLTTEKTTFTINAMKNKDKENIYLYKIPLSGKKMNNNRKIYTNAFDHHYIGRNRVKGYYNKFENTMPNPYVTNDLDKDSKKYNNSYSCDHSDSFEEKTGNITMPTVIIKDTKVIKLNKKFPYKKKIISSKGSKNIFNISNKNSSNENTTQHNINNKKINNDNIKKLRDNLQGPVYVKVDLTSGNNDKKVMKHVNKLNTNIYDGPDNKFSNEKNMPNAKNIQAHIQIQKQPTRIFNTHLNHQFSNVHFTDNNLAKLSVRDCINNRYVSGQQSPNNKQINVCNNTDPKNNTMNYVVSNANLSKFTRKDLSKHQLNTKRQVPVLHLENVQQQPGNLTERTMPHIQVGINKNLNQKIKLEEMKKKNSDGTELIKVNKAAAPAVNPNDK